MNHMQYPMSCRMLFCWRCWKIFSHQFLKPLLPYFVLSLYMVGLKNSHTFRSCRIADTYIYVCVGICSCLYFVHGDDIDLQFFRFFLRKNVKFYSFGFFSVLCRYSSSKRKFKFIFALWIIAKNQFS